MKGKRPPDWFRGVSGKEMPDGELHRDNDFPVGQGKPTESKEVPAQQAERGDSQDFREVRDGLLALAQGRGYTGYHLILHSYDPKTDDETWEAVTQGMTLKDLVFAAANMTARIQELMRSAHEPEPLPPTNKSS